MDNNKRRALGRGLEELFTNNEPMDIEKVEEKIIESTPKEAIQEVNLSELRSNPYQPRQVFDEEKLKELAISIQQYGVIQPIIVKKSIKGYEIIAGERRVKASIMAGKQTVPAIIRDFTDAEMMQIAVLENLQRENLSSTLLSSFCFVLICRCSLAHLCLVSACHCGFCSVQITVFQKHVSLHRDALHS